VVERHSKSQKTKKPIVIRESRLSSALSAKGRPQPLLQLQRTLGNRRVAQLLKAKRLTSQGKILGLQGKLTVGAAHDPYEQEAEHVARHVLGVPDAAVAHSMQREIKPFAAATTLIHAKSADSLTDSFEAGAAVESQISQSAGRGSPLPDSVRAYMEPRFGADFSEVRVHTGSEAIQMNRDVGAEAFTHGSDIYFGAGNSPGNLEITAHELTHVVQQTGGRMHRKLTAGEARNLSQAEMSVQRRIGDGHDLTSPRFAGDPVLEACFDNERLLTVGAQGAAVRKLQQALVDAGFPLPKFGVDEKFGGETQSAVRDFQAASGIKVDGKVGPQTMGALDARFSGPTPPTPVPPLPVPPPPVPPVGAALKADLQALVDAKNTTYLTYKTRINAATGPERAAALSDTTLLRNIQGVLAQNDFAKTVELLGRSAPTAGTMLGDATVSAAMSAAFTASNPAVTLPPHNPANPVGPCNPPAGTPPPAGVHEEGGWIYLNLITGSLATRRAPGGGQASINLGGPPDVADSIVVGTFHTHPNVGPCWGVVFPSGTDTNSANSTGVPWLIIGAFPDVATTQTTSTGPGRRLHLAGNRGFPGAAGGIAPQATIDGSFDDV
jgi:hypothetical protein